MAFVEKRTYSIYKIQLKMNQRTECCAKQFKRQQTDFQGSFSPWSHPHCWEPLEYHGADVIRATHLIAAEKQTGRGLG